MTRWKILFLPLLAILAGGTAPLAAARPQPAPTAQPPIDGDLVPLGKQSPPTYPAAPPPPPATPPATDPTASPAYQDRANQPLPSASSVGEGCVPSHAADGTYSRDDLLHAAEGAFGEAAHGLADIIQDLLKKDGRPDAYISGREAGGAFAVGLRYGSGKLCSQIVRPGKVYWTGPSIGFDVGASAAQTFVLVYNLTKSDDLFHRYGAGEGQAYLLGGFHVSYLRRGNVVLIPVRSGLGFRLGINGGYMKFSHHQNWMPF